MSDLSLRLRCGEKFVLDGALGTELVNRGVPMHGTAWSATALFTHSAIVRDVHQAYVNAGAQIHIANTFSSSRHSLETAGHGDRTVEANQRAVMLVREAIERAQPSFDTWVAGSISTFGGRVGTIIDRVKLRTSYTEQAEILAAAGCDLIVLEMMLSHEAEMALDISGEMIEVALATGLPVWFGYSCKLSSDRETLYLYDGADPQYGGDDGARFSSVLMESLSDGLAAAGPMHCDLAATGPALAGLKTVWKGPIFVYPNSGHALQRPWETSDVTTPAQFASSGRGWIAAGAQVVGGCCGIHPEHIAALQGELPEKVTKA